MLDAPVGASALSPEGVTAFKEQLGVHDYEDSHFGWIAEVGLQSPLPPRWTSHADEQSGFIYYVDHDRQTSTWENPLVPHLRRIVEIGRQYLRNPCYGFFEEQKGTLWHQHKHGLDCWHGPFLDDEGRKYFVHAIDQVSSWEDPRVDAQYIFELESGLLSSLEEVLPRPDGDAPLQTEGGAQVLTFIDEGMAPCSPQMTSSTGFRGGLTNGWRKTGALIGMGATGGVTELKKVAAQTAKKEHTTTLQKMDSVAAKVQGIQQDEEEAQRLALARKVEERRQRKRVSKVGSGAIPSGGRVDRPDEAPVPPPPLPGQLPEEGGGAATDRGDGSSRQAARASPAPLELDDEAEDGPPKELAEVGCESPAPRPPSMPPSPLAGRPPRLLPALQRRVTANADAVFRGDAFARLELKGQP